MLNEHITKEYRGLLQFVEALISNKADAEDILMLSFEKALSSYKEDEIKDIKKWLYKILHRTVIDFYRKDSVRRETLATGIKVENQPNNQAIDSNLKYQFLSNIVQEYLEELNENHKAALEFYLTEDFSYKEISEKTNLSIKSITHVVNRFRTHIINKLRS